MYRIFLLVASAGALAAVALGAFGAHGLRGVLDPSSLAIYHTGVQYHMWHALALWGIALLLHGYPDNPWLIRAGWLMTAGLVLFSGSLYLLSISGLRWIGMITPLGGVAFLLAWASLFCFAWRLPAGS